MNRVHFSGVIRRNYKGEFLGNNPVELIDSDFGTGEIIYGLYPEVNWPEEDAFVDDEGFDKTRHYENGNYKIFKRLPYGTELIRYGNERGSFTAPKGTPYEKLSLPYKKESIEYYEYTVIADSITVLCIVEEGIVAPAFGMEGGGIQYLHEMPIERLIKRGMLRRMEKSIYGNE